MTESNFISLHFPTGQINTPGSIHLNINQAGLTTQGIITSIIITENALSLNNQTTNTDLGGVLGQIDTLKFTFDNIRYELIITSKTYYSTASNPFFYYTVEPVSIANIFDADLYTPANEQITLSPFLQDIEFGFSEYNPLIGNAERSRKSTNKMKSDRLEKVILPTNLNAILNESAEKAAIQDSLYSSTGWTNARYNGTLTSAQESAGIAPSITGRTFTGEVFSSETDTDYICALDNRLNQELFHTANTELPVSSLSDTVVTLRFALGGQQTELIYNEITGRSQVEVGDVIKGPISTGITPQSEFLKIQNIDANESKLTVSRNIYNNYPLPLPTYTAGTEFTKVSRFDIFKFGTGQNRIQLVSNSRIYVDGSNAILDTDDFGQIASSSLCPYIGYIVTD